jgi:hypothetical protein
MPPESGEEKPNDQIQCGMGAVAGSGHHLWQLKQTADSSSESMAEPPPACCPCASMHRRPSTWACTFLDLAAAKSDLLDPRRCLPAGRSMDLATGTEREDAPYQTWAGEPSMHWDHQFAPLPMSASTLLHIGAPSSRSIICGAAFWFSI